MTYGEARRAELAEIECVPEFRGYEERIRALTCKACVRGIEVPNFGGVKRVPVLPACGIDPRRMKTCILHRQRDGLPPVSWEEAERQKRECWGSGWGGDDPNWSVMGGCY